MNKEKLAVKPTAPDLAAYKRFAKKIIISFAWVLHLDKFKIPSESRKHYKRIFYKTRSSIGCSPSIFTGEDFNNKMKWLMIFRQSKKQIEFCDKVTTRPLPNAGSDQFTLSVDQNN